MKKIMDPNIIVINYAVMPMVGSDSRQILSGVKKYNDDVNDIVIIDKSSLCQCRIIVSIRIM